MKIYLAGPIEKCHDGGVGVRKGIRHILNKFEEGITLIDPCDFNINKKYKHLREVIEHNRQWRSIIRKNIRDDLNAVEQVDVVIAILNKSSGHGTAIECIQAWRNNVPVIGFFSKDVYNNRDKLHPWLRASLAEECCTLDELEKMVKRYLISTAYRR